MLSIRDGGIWPRRTPARGDLRGSTALAYGGSRRAMAPSARPLPHAVALSMQPPRHAAALSMQPPRHAAALSMQPPRRARVFGRKTDAPLVLGQDLGAQSAPSVRKSPGNAFSVRISPKNERHIQNVKLGNVKLGSNWDSPILTNLIFAHYPYAAALSTQASALRLRG